jgi:mRNA-degrading endonuclease toxin of MazEF toxin-antitoxin module
MVVPCTSSDLAEKTRFPNNVPLSAGSGGLPRDSAAMVHLVQPLETSNRQRLYGTLADEDLTRVLHGLAWAVDLFEHV